MNRQEAIKKLYFECKYNQKEIAETLEISNKYVSKVLLEDSRYKEEKENGKWMAVTGLALGIIDIVCVIIYLSTAYNG